MVEKCADVSPQHACWCRYEQIRSLPVLIAFTIIVLPLSIGDGILNAFVYSVFFQVGYLCTACRAV